MEPQACTQESPHLQAGVALRSAGVQPLPRSCLHKALRAPRRHLLEVVMRDLPAGQPSAQPLGMPIG